MGDGNKTIYFHAGVSMNWFNQWIKSCSLAYMNTIETNEFKIYAIEMVVTIMEVHYGFVQKD